MCLEMRGRDKLTCSSAWIRLGPRKYGVGLKMRSLHVLSLILSL